VFYYSPDTVAFLIFNTLDMIDDDSLSEQDKALFREHMRCVKPLKASTPKTHFKAPAPTHKPQNRKPDPLLGSSKKDYFLSDYLTETVHTHTVLSYSHPNLPNKRFKSLRNGQIPWESRLDLHGMQADAARNALGHFIETQALHDKRCVLIIHGKGGQEGAPPIIKNLVNRWLPQIKEVLAVHSALPKDGGHGAVYVLLKRNRSS
jgi:DNA-nicking Smr family endonuclease